MKTKSGQSEDPFQWKLLTEVSVRTGYSEEALRAYKKKGLIVKDVHWIKRRGRIFIHAMRFNEWIEKSPE
jgi:hypothetical protein